MPDSVLIHREGAIATITLNRPETLNALTPEMSAEYVDALTAADKDPSVRAIVVTGAGRGFCSGADLSILESGTLELQAYTKAHTVETLPLLALRLGTPVITAINGPAAGIGFVLALCADKRFMSEGIAISATFPRLGLVAEYGVAWLLPRLVGLPHATDILLTGRKISTDEAASMGLVTAVPDAYEAAMEWARELISTSSPRAMATIKHQLLAAQDHTLDQATTESLALMSESFGWPDLAEVLSARRDNRQPQFPDFHGGVGNVSDNYD